VDINYISIYSRRIMQR